MTHRIQLKDLDAHMIMSQEQQNGWWLNPAVTKSSSKATVPKSLADGAEATASAPKKIDGRAGNPWNVYQSQQCPGKKFDKEIVQQSSKRNKRVSPEDQLDLVESGQVAMAMDKFSSLKFTRPKTLVIGANQSRAEILKPGLRMSNRYPL